MSAEQFPRSLRALLTETLPFELPVIFTNEFRFRALLTDPIDPKVAQAFATLLEPPSSVILPYTIPHQYLIRKDRNGATSLSLIHPRSQVDVARFYGEYAETIMSACALSDFSLRYPSKLASIYSPKELESTPTAKAGQVHVEPDPAPDELDVSRVVSFFSYKKMNLLAKFFDSQEYLDLEKRFSKLRTLDVSRCFYNIYTHSLTWAVKSKPFAKAYANCYAFEQQFDRLMQRLNYNETNGIVVGPELSRLFAEVIFQRLDVNLIAAVKEVNADLILGEDYDVRRYVDDYFIYANDTETLDLIQNRLELVCEEYKLYLNDAKLQNFERPFVTPLSTAKRQVRRAIFDLKTAVDAVRQTQDPKDFRHLAKAVKSKTVETRLIIGEHGVGFHNISAWCLTILNGMLAELFGALAKVPLSDEDRINCYERSLWSVFSLIFYICSLDIRVSTTYALGQILTLKETRGYSLLLSHSDWIDHLIERELLELCRQSHAAFFKKAGRTESVETGNLLILGAHFFGASFTNATQTQKIVNDLINKETSYFNYIACKFVLLKDVPASQQSLNDLNEKAINYIEMEKRTLRTAAHPYFIACDLLSSPDLTVAERQRVWKAIKNETLPKATLEDLGKICGFVDWKALKLSHSLKRKRLRPVYE